MSKLHKLILEIFSSGYQIQPDAFQLLESISESDAVRLVKLVINSKNVSESKLITRNDIEKFIDKPAQKDVFDVEEVKCEINVMSNFTFNENVVEGIDGYRFLFSSRFDKLMSIVKQRRDSSQIQKIGSVNSNIIKPTKIAGFIMERKITPSSTEIVVDDDSGKMTIHAIDASVGKKVSELLLDQLIIAEIAVNKQNNFFLKTVYSPDVPDRVASTSKKNAYIIFTSDLHIGSDKFLTVSFEKFLKWISGLAGDLDVVKKITCLVFAGDLIDGGYVNQYPTKGFIQQDVFEQYKILLRYLAVLPKHIKIILIPGEHDITRRALPQPAIPEKFVGDLRNTENIMFLSNPSQFIVNGVNVISYHGNSLDDVIASTPNQVVSRPAQAMKLLLKARHLAPQYGGRTQIAPETEDKLVIEQIPDVFHAGHLHIVDMDSYRGSVILNSGTWQAQTTYQEIAGVTPTPGIVPVMNLANLEVTMKSFAS
jgi:DNA polymerase II small subunit